MMNNTLYVIKCAERLFRYLQILPKAVDAELIKSSYVIY